MNRRALFTITTIIALILCVAWLKWHRNGDDPKPSLVIKQDTLVKPDGQALGQPSADDSDLAPVAVPDNCRSAVQSLYRFAAMAPLYKFDPQLSGARAETSRHRSDWVSVVVQTRSHVAQIINGKIISLNSLYNGSDTRRRPEAVDDWHKATGTMSEAEAITQTVGLLEKLGENKTLEELKGGTNEFRAESVSVKDANGERVRVVPFRTLWLYDRAGSGRVETEFRMGPTGSLGITKWFKP